VPQFLHFYCLIILDGPEDLKQTNAPSTCCSRRKKSQTKNTNHNSHSIKNKFSDFSPTIFENIPWPSQTNFMLTF